MKKKNKENLDFRYDTNSKKIVRAKQLLESLGSEKGRWKDLAGVLKEQKIRLTGDILVSSGIVAYLGPFTAVFRTQIVKEWSEMTLSKNIPGTKDFSIAECLG